MTTKLCEYKNQRNAKNSTNPRWKFKSRKTFGSKRYAREQLLDLERSLKRVEEEEAYALEDLEKADNTIKLYENLAKKIELTSAYRKRLEKSLTCKMSMKNALAAIAKPKKYFEKKR